MAGDDSMTLKGKPLSKLNGHQEDYMSLFGTLKRLGASWNFITRVDEMLNALVFENSWTVN